MGCFPKVASYAASKSLQLLRSQSDNYLQLITYNYLHTMKVGDRFLLAPQITSDHRLKAPCRTNLVHLPQGLHRRPRRGTDRVAVECCQVGEPASLCQAGSFSLSFPELEKRLADATAQAVPSGRCGSQLNGAAGGMGLGHSNT